MLVLVRLSFPELVWHRHTSVDGDYVRGCTPGLEVRLLLDLDEVEVWPGEDWDDARVHALVGRLQEALARMSPHQS